MATHILPRLRGSGIQVTWGLFSSGVMAAVGNTMTDRKLLFSHQQKNLDVFKNVAAVS